MSATTHANAIATGATMVTEPRATTAAVTFEAVFRREAEFVLRTVRRMGVRPAEVEDVAQDVFVVVHRKLGQFDGRCALRSWLFGVVYRVVADHRRKAHVRREVITDRPPPATTAHAAAEERMPLAAVDAALRQLDDKHRAVFVLFELEGMTMKDVADAVGCPLHTAYTRLRKARRRVLSAMGISNEGGAR